MKIDKPGRYKYRDGAVAKVFAIADSRGDYPVLGIGKVGMGSSWTSSGVYCMGREPDDYDLIEYLGPLQPGDDGFDENGGDA